MKGDQVEEESDGGIKSIRVKQDRDSNTHIPKREMECPNQK